METTTRTAQLQFDEPTAGTRRRGLRLWRIEVLNWGTLGEDAIHSVDLNGGWLCITGRNGTGKSTLADAVVTAFPPANMRIVYNAAGGAKNTKERTRLTYLRGYYGHEQDKTGRAQPSALRGKLTRARFCITVSEYNRAYLLGLSPASDIRLLRTGIALDRFPFRPGAREPFVLGVGRFVAKKGFDTLDAACPEDFPLHLIGDGPERARIKRATVHGFLPRSTAYQWICRAGLLVLPCRIAADGDRDGIPTVLSEGMAAGTPVLASRVTGIPEVCSNLFPPDDPSALRQRILEMMVCPPSAASLWAGRQWVEKHCDVDTQSAVLRSFL